MRGDRRPDDITSLNERMRYMQAFRFAVAAVASSFALLAPELLPGQVFRELLPATLAYLLISIASESWWRLSPQRGLTVFGAMLILDGVYLAWLSYTTGGSASPLRSLIVLHLVAVALLASYRTGLKLALWHSLLLLVVFHGQEAQILQPLDASANPLPGTEAQRLVGFVGLLWLVTLATGTFSAVNERELRRRRFDLEALADFAAELDQADGSLAAGDVFLETVVDIFDFPRAALVSAHHDDLILMGARGCSRVVLAQAEAPKGSVLRRALDTRQTLLESNLDPREDAWLLQLMPSTTNVVVVPLSAEGSSIGVLVAEHGLRRGSRIERRVVSMVERFAAHAALALRSAWLVEQLRAMAATDGLTLIANRRTFESTLAREVSRARRTGSELSVVMLDLDHFKSLNDTHGHQIGDDVLRDVASLIKQHCRDFDTPARYGGEEFAVVLPGSSSTDALMMAERLRQLIADADTAIPVTASLGVATFPIDAVDEAALIRVADEALYESKRAGRNRVTSSGTSSRLVVLPPPPATGVG